MTHGMLRGYARPGVVAFTLVLLLVAAGCPRAPRPPRPPEGGRIGHVIYISVDGLRSDAVTALGPELAPHFFRLRDEGAFTDNARTDPVIANTLPNHASEFTGRGVFGRAGHGWFINDDPGAPITLHLFKLSYVASVFDVAHDFGLSTALYANKRKFSVFDRSWNEIHGAEDRTGGDNGRDKIDTYFFDDDMVAVANAFVGDLAKSDYNFAFLHLRQPDSIGHNSTWDLTPGSDYLNAVVEVDAVLGDILELVATDRELVGTTTIILTSDHGGELGTTFHLLIPKAGLIESGIVPFYVWGQGVPAGADLYALNPTTRQDPGTSIPPFSDPLQPIRNGDAANLSLDLLGLPPVSGSTINVAQDLATNMTSPQ
ncbi:MAG: alkaline phosphatase family protein [Candidatus Methylomirabilales bacterium]